MIWFFCCLVFFLESWQLFLERFARFCKVFQDRGKKSKKIFGLFGKKTKTIQDLGNKWKKIQDLGKKFKIIQDYPRSWQENQDAKHWDMIVVLKLNVFFYFSNVAFSFTSHCGETEDFLQLFFTVFLPTNVIARLICFLQILQSFTGCFLLHVFGRRSFLP